MSHPASCRSYGLHSAGPKRSPRALDLPRTRIRAAITGETATKTLWPHLLAIVLTFAVLLVGRPIGSSQSEEQGAVDVVLYAGGAVALGLVCAASRAER